VKQYLNVEQECGMMRKRMILEKKNIQKLHHRRPQTEGGFKKCLEEQGQTHELAAAGIVKMSAMRAGNHFTFIFFRFTSFVATLDTEK
jgi:hypothetical protein